MTFNLSSVVFTISTATRKVCIIFLLKMRPRISQSFEINHEGHNSGGRQWFPATSRPVSAEISLMRNIVLNKLNLWSGRFEIRRDCKDNQY